MNEVKNIYEEHGLAVLIICIILALALGFGLMCASAALFMVCWNFAVVAAIPICAPISFWVAFVFILAMDFLTGSWLRILMKKRD